MIGQASNDTFISYRRDVGDLLALALWQSLSQHGIDAFYDIDNIRAGEFREVILSQIAARPYFLLVLCPGTLEGCSDPDSWLRKEIEHALDTERLIVPAYTPIFDFADCNRYLPGDLGPRIRGYQAQELPHKYFTFAVQQLVEKLLCPVERADETVAPGSQRVVDEIQHRAEHAQKVTAMQLSAQEYFERGYSRPSDDDVGRIADYTEAIRLNPRFAPPFNNRAVVRKQMGNFDGALADFSEAIRLDPRNAKVFCNRASLRGEMSDLDGAIDDYSEAIRLNPEDAVAFYARANYRKAKGDFDGAIADHTEAIQLVPKYTFAIFNRGLARHLKGDLNEALSDYDEAIRLEPKNAEAFNNRSLVRRDMGDLDDALADLDKAIRIDPNYADAFCHRALVHNFKGNRKRAIKDYNKAIKLKPRDSEALFNRGVTREEMGDRNKALADYRKAVRVDPGLATRLDYETLKAMGEPLPGLGPEL